MKLKSNINSYENKKLNNTQINFNTYKILNGD